MTSEPINDLFSISDDVDLEDKLGLITDELKRREGGIESVESILLFMEQHPDWNFGSPGPLVHFVEKFYKNGYEYLLTKSIARRVTAHTAWMLNRVINGEVDSTRKMDYLCTLQQAEKTPGLDEITKEEVRNFLNSHGL